MEKCKNVDMWKAFSLRAELKADWVRSDSPLFTACLCFRTILLGTEVTKERFKHRPDTHDSQYSRGVSAFLVVTGKVRIGKVRIGKAR